MTGPLGAGLAALRRFYRPFLLIQFVAVLLVVAFYNVAAVRVACATLAAIKIAGGLPFAAVSASIAGGLLPEVAKLIGNPRRYTLRGRGSEILFNLAFFAFNGVLIDVFYRGEAQLFGDDASVATVAKKTIFDQFVFTPLWLPIIIALYLWRQKNFSLSETVTAVRARGFYKTRVLPLLLPDWCFWIPMVSIIYALPVPLQFLLFILALGAWSLIMVFIATATPESIDAPESTT
jgi:hypothetical protein